MEVGRQLDEHSFAFIDGFLGHELALEVRSIVDARSLCNETDRGGQVKHGRVSALRSDVSSWQQVDASGSSALDRLVNQTDKLVSALRDTTAAADLSAVRWRSADAMLACYAPHGSRYVRHLDNVCSRGQGKRCNGRRLTMVYYLNDPAADAVHGALRLFRQGPPTSEPLVDVEPLLDRLVVFHSDERVPHAVLPTGPNERRAVTMWYFDAAELARGDESDGAQPRLSAVPAHEGSCTLSPPST